MPRHDGTGPAGQGPKTGRGNGKCNSSKRNILNEEFAFKQGKGRGRMRGMHNGRNENIGFF